MNSIKERILESASYYGLSIRKFEEKCQLNRGVLGNMGENSSLGSDKLSYILDNCPEINPTWLVTGRGNMLQNDENKSTMRDNIVVNGKGSISKIDNRQYSGGSVDIAPIKIDDKDKLLLEKDKLIAEKDERIREKDEYISDLKRDKEELKQIINELKNK